MRLNTRYLNIKKCLCSKLREIWAQKPKYLRLEPDPSPTRARPEPDPSPTRARNPMKLKALNKWARFNSTTDAL